MKNFKFNLEPLLRLKEVEKKKIELELAHCQLEIDAHNNQLNSEHKSIRDMLIEAEYLVNKNNTIKSLLSVPGILEIKKKNIKLLENQLLQLELTRKEILDR